MRHNNYNNNYNYIWWYNNYNNLNIELNIRKVYDSTCQLS